MLRLVDALAVLVALPGLLSDLYAVLVVPLGTSPEEHLPARLYRRLDRATDYLMSPASYLSVAYLLARAAFLVFGAGVGTGVKVAVWMALAGIAAGLIFPLTSLYNAVAWLLFRNPPIHLDKASYFPKSRLLEDPETFAAIRKELVAVLASDLGIRRFTDVFHNVSIVERDEERSAGAPEGGGWRSFFLRVGDRPVPESLARVPTLASLLRDMPEVYNAFFSILDPGHGLTPHRGYFKGVVRYHLGMLVPSPEDAWLVCGGETYHWKEGEGVLFDDMFVHSVVNRCASPRVVLFMDVRRPLGPLGRLLSEAVAWLIDVHPYHRAVRKKVGM